MRWLPFTMPDGWPVSLGFFVITLAVYLLQRFPLTGVFLMIVGAAFWSILLINLGMAGLALEAVTGRTNFLWIIIPALYAGGYYWAYASDQQSLAIASKDVAALNEGKTLAFDPERQDLLIEDPGETAVILVLPPEDRDAFASRSAITPSRSSTRRLIMNGLSLGSK